MFFLPWLDYNALQDGNATDKKHFTKIAGKTNVGPAVRLSS